MNARMGVEQNSRLDGKFGETIRSDNDDSLINICEEFKLTIINGFLMRNRNCRGDA